MVAKERTTRALPFQAGAVEEAAGVVVACDDTCEFSQDMLIACMLPCNGVMRSRPQWTFDAPRKVMQSVAVDGVVAAIASCSCQSC